MAMVNTMLYGELAIIPREAEIPIRETLEFLTDVLESYNGSEQRLRLRSMARQTLAYTVPLQAAHLAGAFNTEWAAIRKLWAVPLWMEAQYLGKVFENNTVLSCNIEYYDFRDDSLALLYSSCDKWQILEIDTVTDDGLTLLNDTQAFHGAWLVPVRVGWIAHTVEQAVNGYNGKSTIVFEIDDVKELVPVEPPQYLGNDFYIEPTLLSGGTVDKVIEQRLDENDFDLGLVARRSPWRHARVGTPYRRILQGMKEVFEYREFLYRRAGKYRMFWLPSFEINMRLLSTGLITNKFIIASDSYIDYALNRNHLAIHVGFSWYFTEVINAIQLDADRVEITIAANLNVQASDVRSISYAGLNRLDTDRIELNWTSNQIADVEVRALELQP